MTCEHSAAATAASRRCADVNLRVAAGELVALVGANGAGKTTLLRAISGVQPACAGAIGFDGQEVTALTARRRVQLGIVQVPEGRQVFGPLSVEDNLRLGAFARGTVRRRSTACSRSFRRCSRNARCPQATLSGGQQQMLAIARALMAEPRLLLLDEPSMGLAPRLVAEIFAHIAALKARGTTILLVDQNARAALAVADRGYVMETGRIVLEGAAAELLAQPQGPAGLHGAVSFNPNPHEKDPPMKPTLQTGLTSKVSFTVDRERTIDFMGEAARVYATPMLVRDIEVACRNLLLEHLDAGEDSVGTRVEIDHIGATLLGMPVDLTVRVAEINGRAVVFDVEGRDAVEPIVRGRHSRFVVDVAKTAQRLAAKAQKAKAVQVG